MDNQLVKRIEVLCGLGVPSQLRPQGMVVVVVVGLCVGVVCWCLFVAVVVVVVVLLLCCSSSGNQ